MILFPTGSESGNPPSSTPAQTPGNLWRNVDEIHESPVDSSFLAGSGFQSVNFIFSYPSYWTNVSYGDGNSIVDRVQIASVTIRTFASCPTGVDEVLFPQAIHPLLGELAVSAYLVSGASYLPFSTILVNDPFTGAPWVVADLVAMKFGLSFGSGVPVRARSFYLEAAETLQRGNARARLGPNLEEPALFCAICSIPFHLRDLVKVENQRHPMNGRWVCREDFDEINPEPRDPIIEGDIDFDL